MTDLVNKEGNPIHESWRNTGDVAISIMKGEHDDHLDDIRQAAQTRLKVTMRADATPLRKYTVADPNSTIHGKTVVVTKVNQKNVSITVGEPEPKWLTVEEFNALPQEDRIPYFTSVYWLPTWKTNPKNLVPTDDAVYATPRPRWTPPVGSAPRTRAKVTA